MSAFLSNSRNAADRFAEGVAREVEPYMLTLYVAGATARSLAAIENATALCEARLPGRYRLEIIDVYRNPLAAQSGQVIAVPMLVKTLPLPLRHIIGDLSEEGKVLTGLGLKAAA